MYKICSCRGCSVIKRRRLSTEKLVVMRQCCGCCGGRRCAVNTDCCSSRWHGSLAAGWSYRESRPTRPSPRRTSNSWTSTRVSRMAHDDDGPLAPASWTPAPPRRRPPHRLLLHRSPFPHRPSPSLPASVLASNLVASARRRAPFRTLRSASSSFVS